MQPLPSQEFIARFRARLPPDIARSFAPEQMAAIESAFGTRYRPRHLLALQPLLRFGMARYYLTIYFGRDERAHVLGRHGSSLAVGLVIAAAACITIGLAIWAWA